MQKQAKDFINVHVVNEVKKKKLKLEIILYILFTKEIHGLV